MRVFLDCVGCRLNQSELELIAGELRQGGARLVKSPEESEVILLNTCAVTSGAEADSRRAARRAGRRNPRAQMILTGCWATHDPAAAQRCAPGAQVVPNTEKPSVARLVLGGPAFPASVRESAVQVPIPGRRHRVRAFVKAQEGCGANCAFCLTRLLRGPARSVPEATVVQQVQRAIDGGAAEVVLCGVQLGAYGQDLCGGASLEGLVRRLLSETEGARLRLSSIEPWDVSDDLLACWEDPRLCRQLHIPLQSGSRATLARMQRPITPTEFAHVVSRARAAISGLVLTTDLLVGLPGESDAEFDESRSFVERIAFDGAHIFTYSARPGTLAALLPGQVDPPIARKRLCTLRALTDQARQAALARRVGSLDSAVWVRADQTATAWRLTGVTSGGLQVVAPAPGNLRSNLSAVRIHGVRGSVLEADLYPACDSAVEALGVPPNTAGLSRPDEIAHGSGTPV